MKAKEIIVKALHENFSEFTEDQADAVLEAIRQKGFVLVPKEPNFEMVMAGKNIGINIGDANSCYKSMIEAWEQSNDKN